MPDVYIGTKPLWSKELVEEWKANKEEVETAEEYRQ